MRRPIDKHTHSIHRNSNDYRYQCGSPYAVLLKSAIANNSYQYFALILYDRKSSLSIAGKGGVQNRSPLRRGLRIVLHGRQARPRRRESPRNKRYPVTKMNAIGRDCCYRLSIMIVRYPYITCTLGGIKLLNALSRSKRISQAYQIPKSDPPRATKL